MKTSLALFLAIICALALAGLTYSVISVSRNISSTGTINVVAGLGVYSDSACQNNLTTINWGTLSPGASTTYTVYIKNIGSGTSLLLNMTTASWNPTGANGPNGITWNQEGTILLPNQSVATVLTLTISPTITGISNFSVQIDITGTQVEQV